MIPDDIKTKIADVLKRELICVISTVNNLGNSESAAMAFFDFEDFSLAFQTPKNTRKYENLRSNPRVSIVVGWKVEDMVTVQYEGLAHEVVDDKVLGKVRARQLKKNPYSEKYAYLQDNKYFIVDPVWIRYSKLAENDEFVYEYSWGQ